MPGLTDLPGSVGKLEQLVDFLVDVWQSRNWVRRLLVLDVLLALGLNPPVVEGGMRLLGLSAELPDVYKYIWMGSVVAVFLLGLVVAARGRSRAAPAMTDIAERAAIKGLVAFELRDAEIFARLQREQELQECLVAVADRDFRFGYLNGDSGSGKTSFLQAGLWPRLMKQGFRCGYVKFSDQDPERTVRLVLAEWAPAGGVEGSPGLAACLAAAAASEDSPLVLLFDQFEQVFVQRTRAERESFVRELAQWYQEGSLNSAKILLCLRSDFVGQLVELQKAMGYSLGPQQVFRLEKLDPARAAAVLSALGEMAGWAVDEVFVEELARQELADPKDGLVSPVDLQVLAWMIAGQRTAEERAFQRDALRKMGGVEGLLERFLQRALAVRETEARRQAAIKVLLLLTDLDQNVRAGLLTAKQLAEKKDGSLSIKDLREALDWLTRSNVRLVARAQRDGEAAYELAHERLIPALRRIAGRELTAADRANHLLDRRVNEWLGNARAARYLLTWGEVRLIEKMQPYLHWGPQEVPKRELVARSRKRRNRWLTGAAVGVAIPCAVLLWWRSPWGEIWQVKRDLVDVAKKLSQEDETIYYVAGLGFVGGDSLSRHTVEQTYEEEDRFYSYLYLVLTSAAAGRTESARDFLDRSWTIAEELATEAEGGERSGVLPELASIALEAYNLTSDRAFWAKAIAAAIEAKSTRTWLDLVDVEVAHGDLPHALDCLQHARKSLGGGDSEEISRVVTTAERLARETKNPDFLDPGIQVVADSSSGSLVGNDLAIRLARSARELGAPEQKSELRRVLEEQHKMIGLVEIRFRAERLADMAAFAMALGEPARALAYVAEARSLLVDEPGLLWSLDLIEALGKEADALARLQHDIDQFKTRYDDNRIRALSTLAKRAAEIGKVDASLRLLSRAFTYQGSGSTSDPLNDLCQLAVQLGEQTGHPGFLSLAVQAGRQANDYYYIKRLEPVIKAAIKLAEANRNPQFLSPGVEAAEAVKAAKATEAAELHVGVTYFLELARAAASLGDSKLASDLLDRASRVASSTAGLDHRANAYADLAETAATLQQPERSTSALNKGSEAAERIRPEIDKESSGEHRSRALAFARLAGAAATAWDRQRAGDFLHRAAKAMQDMEKEKREPDDVTDWLALATAATKAGDRRRAAEFLDNGFAAAEAQRYDDPRSWEAEAMAAARAGEWGLARRSAAKIPSPTERASVLFCILAHRARQSSPKIAEYDLFSDCK
jgi:hypothetical protein